MFLYEEIRMSYDALLERYQLGQESIELQLSYAHFLAFFDQKPKAASTFLKSAIKQNLSAISAAKLKMKLADILVAQSKFNQALVYYTQIQMRVKNSPLSQEARFKVAKTSYYKGDFDWAETQLKILKSSTSQLTANDALELQLLISDHKSSDSLHTALRLYAKADLLTVQKKPKEALLILDSIIETYKTDPIIDQVLLFQAHVYESQMAYVKAEHNYLQIIKENSGRYIIENIEIINTKFSDYGSAINDGFLVFTSSRDTVRGFNKIHKWTNEPFTNLYQSKLNNTENIENPELFSKSINSKFNESTPVFTKDGQTMYFT